MGLYGTIWDCFSQTHTISDYFRLSWTLWHYLGLSGTIWDYLGLTWSIWDYMGLSGTVSVYHILFRTISDYLGLCGTIWDYLVLSGTIQDYRGLSGTIWDYLVVLFETTQDHLGLGSKQNQERASYCYFKLFPQIFSLLRFLEELALLKKTYENRIQFYLIVTKTQ